MSRSDRRDVEIPIPGDALRGILAIPPSASGIVAFAHGSGSGRLSPRNAYVAEVLNDAGLATLLLDLLTEDEERVDAATAHLRFDIDLLADRLIAAVEWVRAQRETSGLGVGLFGASTGAAAALQVAARAPDEIDAVVSRGGRPDLALEWLPKVTAAALLIVGGEDHSVIPLNRRAFDAITAEREMVIVQGATHLFQEPGALEEVARLAADFFVRHLSAATRTGRGGR
ncbi:MAG TPA: dienelactone hydrolase family protein [Gemmatimonadaceae bacterium]|nr:dienelactone hydrolase family protein [Gemmatimonadaceae bacterium]